MEGTIGFVTPFAGNFAPKNWGYCNGQIININSNTALFSILGTTYGGNGTTTFALPNLQGRAAIGAGQGPGLPNYTLGQVGGAETVTLTVNEMPAHAHMVSIQAQIPCNAETANADNPSGAYPAPTPGNAYSSVSNATANPGALAVTGSLLNAGSGYPFSIIQPLQTVNFVICMYGIFPARN